MSHHITQALYALTRAAVAAGPAGSVAVSRFDPDEQTTCLQAGARSSSPLDRGVGERVADCVAPHRSGGM